MWCSIALMTETTIEIWHTVESLCCAVRVGGFQRRLEVVAASGGAADRGTPV